MKIKPINSGQTSQVRKQSQTQEKEVSLQINRWIKKLKINLEEKQEIHVLRDQLIPDKNKLVY
jgi:hypothetical protein